MRLFCAQHQYDFDNRLKTATLTDGTVIANTFDAAGRKVATATTKAGSTRATAYVLAGDQVLEEYEDGKLSMRYVRGRGIDEIVRAERSSGYDGTLDQVFFPLQDELGNVDRLTDAAGATLERYEYTGYGEFRIFSSSSTEQSFGVYGWRWLFQGREYDARLNAYDFRARTLWPELGRFGQEDPVGVVDSPNRYQAFLGIWSENIDPHGEDTFLVLFGEGYLATDLRGRHHDVGRNFELAAQTRARELKTAADKKNIDLRRQGKKASELWYVIGPLRTGLRDDLIREINANRSSGSLRELHVFSHGWAGGLNLGGADTRNWEIRNFMISDVLTD